MFLFPKVRVLGLDFEEINDFSKEISGELFELDWFLYGGNIKRLNVKRLNVPKRFLFTFNLRPVSRGWCLY